MPELPEVETIRRDLDKKITGKIIKKVIVKKSRLVKGSLKKFQEVLINNKITKINRRGKLIITVLKNGNFLLVHLKMTGQLIYQKNKQVIAGGHSYSSFDYKLPSKYSYIIFDFVDGGQLFFNDMRTFGYMQIVDENNLKIILDKYGIEPLTKDFTLENFTKALEKRRINIKALLLNQNIVAGIGNIYADEICFYAGVLPTRLVFTLTKPEVKKLWQGANVILKKAIQSRGTTFNNYRDADGNKGNFVKYLKVFGQKGKLCKRCKNGKIDKIKLVGRGTHYCNNCQK